MYSTLDLQKLVQMLNYLGINTSPISWTGGPTSSRPTSPTLYQVYFDTTLQQPVVASQVTPSVIWVNAAGVQV
ncbi:hypothetical protein PQQ84_22660 [Paraburkholderia strydomiana]|uniref:hypothetical protein n=1 Tax=Paraburkholderia strydomiana TaxID=1245417 RepID=UPI0038B80481